MVEFKKREFTVNNNLMHNWVFPNTEVGEFEANLADAVADLAEKTGVSDNDIMHLFPAILRILKDNDSVWAK